jgi:hypothetical protein
MKEHYNSINRKIQENLERKWVSKKELSRRKESKLSESKRHFYRVT